MDINRFGQPLSDEQLSEMAPSVMNDEGPSTKLTAKYAFLPTIHLIRDMRELGWFPYVAEQRKPQSRFKKGRRKTEKMMLNQSAIKMHMVTFRNPSVKDEDGLTPEITLINSHDGRNSFRFYAGLYRHKTNTSLIVYDELYEFFKIKHQGYDIEKVKKVISEIMGIMPIVYDKVNWMNCIVMDDHMKSMFALKGVKLRWKEGKTEVSLKDLIAPERKEDSEPSLWNVFLNVQNKIVNGGIQYVLGNGRNQTARALTNIEQIVDVKRELWYYASDIVRFVRKKPHKKSEHKEAEAA